MGRFGRLEEHLTQVMVMEGVVPEVGGKAGPLVTRV